MMPNPEFNKFLYVPGVSGASIDTETWRNFIKLTNLPTWYTASQLQKELKKYSITLTINGDIEFKDKNTYIAFVLKYS